jgi:hypothetical protein
MQEKILEKVAIEGESPVHAIFFLKNFWVKRKLVFVWIKGFHPLSLNNIIWSIVYKYREGKVKKNLKKGVKKNLEILCLQSVDAF